MRIVEVEWTDAQWQSGQMSWSEAAELEPIPARTVGYLIADKKTHVVLANMMWDETGDDEIETKRICLIPKGMIRKIRVLK